MAPGATAAAGPPRGDAPKRPGGVGRGAQGEVGPAGPRRTGACAGSTASSRIPWITAWLNAGDGTTASHALSTGGVPGLTLAATGSSASAEGFTSKGKVGA